MVKGRRIDGKFFESFATTKKKRIAKASAKRLRSRGDLVRVIKVKKGFEIITRKGRK